MHGTRRAVWCSVELKSGTWPAGITATSCAQLADFCDITQQEGNNRQFDQFTAVSIQSNTWYPLTLSSAWTHSGERCEDRGVAIRVGAKRQVCVKFFANKYFCLRKNWDKLIIFQLGKIQFSRNFLENSVIAALVVIAPLPVLPPSPENNKINSLYNFLTAGQ